MEALTRDVVSLVRHVPPGSFDVVVELHLSGVVGRTVAASEAATRRAETQQMRPQPQAGWAG